MEVKLVCSMAARMACALPSMCWMLRRISRERIDASLTAIDTLTEESIRLLAKSLPRGAADAVAAVSLRVLGDSRIQAGMDEQSVKLTVAKILAQIKHTTH